MIQYIYFATGNAHKREELQQILNAKFGAANLGAAKFGAASITVKMPCEAGIEFDPEETGATFLENAPIKARELYKIVKEPVIADDSGLCVDALDGRPGVLSARYGAKLGGAKDGEKLDAAQRNALLLGEIGNAAQRKARFVCSMVLLLDENRFFCAQETLEGEIISPSKNGALGRGSGGFGYDPLLFIPEKGCTVAELSAQEKNTISHRGKATLAIAKFLGNLPAYGKMV
jgi:XTP/dITP diphosphohydrolase